MAEPLFVPVQLAARALCVERGDKMLLKEITAEIPAGQVSLILGHNGAGKTLLMQTLHGLVNPTSGTVEGPDRDVQKMVLQTPVMLRRTASQHFDFLCPGLDKEEKQDWFRRASLVGRMGVPARAMSGGEQQKLAIIGALASRPHLLFLDEPAANLDFEATAFVEEIIKRSKQAGTTIVMVSHNRAQAERLADHILFMDKGRLMEQAPAEQFFTAPQSEAGKTYLKFV
ncbi:ABC-type multidrug transport system, ATPase component [SAR116 cluster alpha proteobacterium HIMB100]|nr:ABC-type multidrug transport system, ATPase component [SAR116 cluster alpha proteobacterium HIMB100]